MPRVNIRYRSCPYCLTNWLPTHDGGPQDRVPYACARCHYVNHDDIQTWVLHQYCAWCGHTWRSAARGPTCNRCNHRNDDQHILPAIPAEPPLHWQLPVQYKPAVHLWRMQPPDADIMPPAVKPHKEAARLATPKD